MCEIVDTSGAVVTDGLQLLKICRRKYKQVRRWNSEKHSLLRLGPECY